MIVSILMSDGVPADGAPVHAMTRKEFFFRKHQVTEEECRFLRVCIIWVVLLL